MAEYKKTGRAQRLVVAGCLVERYRDDIRKNMPEVDAVIGTNEVEQIVAAVRGRGAAVESVSSRTFITTSRRGCSPQPAIPRTSRSPRAATIPARSA